MILISESSFLMSSAGKEKNIGLFSSVAEHWSRKPGVVSSILTGGNQFFFFLY